MLTVKSKNHVEIKHIALTLCITLLCVSVFARQQRGSGQSSNSSTAREQSAPSRVERQVLQPSSGQVRSAPAVTNIQRPSNIIRSPAALSTPRSALGRTGISQPTLRRQTPALSVPSRVDGSNIRGINNRNSVVSPPSSVVRTPPIAGRGGSATITNPSVSLRARIPSISAPSTQPRTGILQSTPTIIDSRTRVGEYLSRSRISSNRTSDIAGLIGRQEQSSLRTSKSQLSGQTRGISSDFRTRLDEALSRNRTRSDEALNRSRIDSSIMRQNPSASIMGRQSSIESRATESKTGHRSSGLLRALGAIGKKTPGSRAETERTHKNINLRVVDNLRAGSAERQRKSDIEHRPDVPNAGIENKSGIEPSYKARSEHRPASTDILRYEHVYWDRHNQLRHRIIWPGYHFLAYYSRGPHFTFRYVYPFYLRRYMFVSLGGYWPIDYSYRRYYWYGCYPYFWYGYYPVAREVTGDTYNYYTYNYYYSDGAVSTAYPAADAIQPVDHNTFADVREKLARQAAEGPAPETTADVQFDEAVKAFEAGDYETAIENFSGAGQLAPDDMVLPFAYSQALFANEQYAEAAKTLRAALAQMSPEKEGVFYPRGLYSDDEVLFGQIERLSGKARQNNLDSDLQLLLGYQLLGIGESDKAVEALAAAAASRDPENAAAAKVLLDLVAKIKIDTESENAAQ
jgi:hypothetical protein